MGEIIDAISDKEKLQVMNAWLRQNESDVLGAKREDAGATEWDRQELLEERSREQFLGLIAGQTPLETKEFTRGAGFQHYFCPILLNAFNVEELTAAVVACPYVISGPPARWLRTTERASNGQPYTVDTVSRDDTLVVRAYGFDIVRACSWALGEVHIRDVANYERPVVPQTHWDDEDVKQFAEFLDEIRPREAGSQADVAQSA